MANRLYSIRTRLTLVFGGLAVLMGLTVTLFVDVTVSHRMTQERGEELHAMALSIGQTLSDDLAQRQSEIVLLSKMPNFSQPGLDAVGARSVLDLALKEIKEYAWIGIAAPDGRVLVASNGHLEGVNVGQRPWFVKGMTSAYIGDVHEALLLANLLAPKADEPLRFLDFVSPILDAQGQVQAVMGAHVHWSLASAAVRKMLPPSAQESGVEVLVTNETGVVLYPRERMGPIQFPRDVSVADPRVVTWGDEGSFLTGVATFAPTTKSNVAWRIVARQPVERALAPVRDMQRMIVAVGVLVVLASVSLAYWAAGRISRPVVQIAEAARSIEAGDETASIPDASHSAEIHELSEALRGMTATLIHRRHAVEEANVTLEHRVQERTSELADLFNNAPIGYHSTDRNGVIRAMNDRELDMLGYGRDEVVGKLGILDLLAPEPHAAVRERMVRLRHGESLQPFDARLQRKDGTLLSTRLNTFGFRDAAGTFLYARTAVMDVSQLHEAEVALRQQQALNEAIIHSEASGVLLYRSDGQCILANEAAAAMVGATRAALLGQNCHDTASWRGNGLYEGMLAALQGHASQLTLSMVSTFGKAMDAQVSLVPLHHDDQHMALMVLKDISEVMAANRQLEQMARRDALTQLHNRLAANERLREEFLRMKRSGVEYAVLLIDIDHFKRVNDTYGHEIGDKVLQHAAQLLSAATRTTDFVARFGGEEFLIVLPGTQEAGARAMAEKVRCALADSSIPPVGQVTLSIGLSMSLGEDANEDVAVRRADMALYRAKQAGRNRVEV